MGAKQTVRIAHQTTPRPSGHQYALYCGLQPHFNSMTALETERKYRTKTTSGEKLGGDSTAKPTLSPLMVSGHSHSIVLINFNQLNHKENFLLTLKTSVA
jgi:hypothetical protein